jgi:di/tricarboxylate transporter
VTFRSRYGLSVVGIRRDGEALTGKLVDEALQMGDTLLVVGNWSLIRQLQTHHRDFLLLGLPAEVDEMAPARSQAIHALIALGVMIVLMVTDPVPNVIAALIACLLMGKFRCIDLESAYKSIHWPTLILIVGMLPFALQQTGGVDLIVGALISAVGEMGPG